MTSPTVSAPTFGTARAGDPVRLTARGRMVMLAIAACAAIALAAIALTGLAAPSAHSGAPGPAPTGSALGEALAASGRADSHTVVAGDTLWDLARQTAPGSDPRPVVDRIRQINDLDGSRLSIGQRVWLPAPGA